MDRPAADDDFMSVEGFGLSVPLGDDSNGTPPIEQELANLRLRLDRQVLPEPGAGIEIADGGGNSSVECVRDSEREIAVTPLAVLIEDVFEAELGEGFGARPGEAGPQLGEDPAHRNTALIAVPVVLEVHVPLELAKVRQDIPPAPTFCAERLPFVVIGRRAAVGKLTVDAGAATHYPRLLVLPRHRPHVGPIVRYRL